MYDYQCLILAVYIKHKIFNFLTVINGVSIRKLSFIKCFILFKEFF